MASVTSGGGGAAALCRSALSYVFFAYTALVNQINWQPKALRQLRKIEARAGKQIRVAVSTELVDLNAARNVKSLVVSVEEVRKRDERTY